MINQRPSPPDERHYPEPEIIPPDRPGHRRRDGGGWSRIVIDQSGVRRIYVGRIGPLGLIPFALLGGFISLALLIFFLGAFLILLPLLGLIVGGTAIAGLMRLRSRH
jgi:hypothetical protein